MNMLTTIWESMMGFPHNVDEDELMEMAKNNQRVFNVINAYALHLVEGTPLNNSIAILKRLSNEHEILEANDLIRSLNASTRLGADALRSRVDNASSEIEKVVQPTMDKLDAQIKEQQRQEEQQRRELQDAKQETFTSMFNYTKEINVPTQQPKVEIPKPDPNREQILGLLEQRLNDVKKEVKGFRKGHEDRLFALNEIIKEVKNTNGKIELGSIENNIHDRLDSEDPDKALNFLKGIRADSAAHKGKDSAYQQMKDKINEIQKEPEAPKTRFR